MFLEEYKIPVTTKYTHCFLEPRHPQNEGRRKKVIMRNRNKKKFKNVFNHLYQNAKTELQMIDSLCPCPPM